MLTQLAGGLAFTEGPACDSHSNVFFTDQPNDPAWDWHAQNILMVQALTKKHYDVNFCWAIGTHSGKQGGAIMPDMLR